MESEFIASLLVILFTIAFIYLIFYLVKRTHRLLVKEWTILSKRLQMQLHLPTTKWGVLTGKYPALTGKYKDFQIDIIMYNKGHGDSKVTYTQYAILLANDRAFNLHLYKEGFFSKVGKFFGMQDIQFNHEKFDESYIIKSDNEMAAKRVLNNRIRQLLLRNMPKMRGEFSKESNMLIYKEVLSLVNEKNRKSWLNSLHTGIEIAKEIDQL